MELTNDAGETWYIANGYPAQKTTGLKQNGTFTISSATWASNDALTTDIKKSLRGTIVCTVSADGQVKLMKDGSSVAAGTDGANYAASPTITITIDENGALSITAVGGTGLTLSDGVVTGHFCVRASDNATSGAHSAEADSAHSGHASDNIAVAKSSYTPYSGE